MTLRTRLTLFFIGIVVLPLAAATLAYQVLQARGAAEQTDSRLEGAASAVAVLWEERLTLARRSVEEVADHLAVRLEEPGLTARLSAAVREQNLDFLVVVGPEGVVASAGRAADFLNGSSPRAEELAADQAPPGVIRAVVRVGDGRFEVVGGRYTGQRLVRELGTITGLDVLIVRSGRVLAATFSPVPRDVSGEEVGGRLALEVPVGPGEGAVVLVSTEQAGNTAALWLVAAAGLAAATALGWALASVLARPLDQLAEGARRVAAGDLETTVDAGGASDVARVADAFNAMTANVRAYVRELEQSRDELKGSLDRLGATLRTTLDLPGMLEVVLDTAAVTLGAQAGAVFLLRPSGREVRLEVARGYRRPRGRRTIPVGKGIAGVASTGRPVVVPAEPGREPLAEAHPPLEPQADSALAVPLVRGNRTIGVIALYGRTTGEPFVESDAETLASFAGQASVAIENVLLHRQTELLSNTDSLTEVANRRAFESTLAKEIERAQRFGRSISVLMVDIDRFKRVNDHYGHPRGDEVLVEVARRISGTIRTQIDSVARYGGEEFMAILPETPRQGGRFVGEKIRRAVAERPFESPDGPDLDLTVSVGVATFPPDGTTVEDLVAAADQAMYRAKRGGRDRVEPASA